MSTKAVTLEDFLRARIKEDKRKAKYLLDNWPTSREDMTWLHWHTTPPARVLAECEAKRRILRIHSHSRETQGCCRECDGHDPIEYMDCDACFDARQYADRGGWCLTLRALALNYAAHSDYEEDWAL